MAISGTNARIFFSTSTGTTGAVVANMTQWTLNVDGGTIDTNIFGSSWRSAIASLRGWSGSAAGFWAATTGTGQRKIQSEILAASQGHIQLRTNSAAGDGYQGNCFISGLQTQAQVDGAVAFSFDFVGNSSLSYSSSLS